LCVNHEFDRAAPDLKIEKGSRRGLMSDPDPIGVNTQANDDRSGIAGPSFFWWTKIGRVIIEDRRRLIQKKEIRIEY